MKRDEITFITKRSDYFKTKKPVVTVTKATTGGVQVMFYHQNHAILNHTNCVVGYTHNRIYFLFNENIEGYKLIEAHKGSRDIMKIVIGRKKANHLEDYVSTQCYDFRFDEECGLNYIEKEGYINE